MEISICTYNCCSLRKNIDIVRELTSQNYDVVFLQETLITEDKLGLIDYIDENYEAVGIGATYSDKSLSSVAGRPQGGMACLWRAGSPFHIDEVLLLDENICVLTIVVGDFRIVLVNLYFRSDIWEIETLSEYLDNLSKLDNILVDYNFNAIYFIGDFNADPFRGRAWNTLQGFMMRNSLKCFDYEILDPDTITFLSYDNSHSKWLDHIIGKDLNCSYVSDIKVHEHLMGSDHFPLSARISIQRSYSKTSKVVGQKIDKADMYVDWPHLGKNEFEQIEAGAKILMNSFFMHPSVLCKKVGCMKEDHIIELKSLYKQLVTSLSVSSQQFAKIRRKKNKFKIIPGWNRRVKSYHKIARDNYLRWVELGKPRDNCAFQYMKDSRKEFKRNLNECVLNESEEIDIAIEEKYKSKDFNGFWRDIKKKRINRKKSNIIDGKSKDNEIVDIFMQKFLIDCQNSDETENFEETLINELKRAWLTSRKFYVQISACTIRKYINNLKPGMGHDYIHSCFLENASDEYLEFIANFMNACFNHCFIPTEVLYGDIHPTLKDEKGNMTVSSNYRPVMQSSCILKVFEMHLLSILEERVSFNCRQFGFEKGKSTSDACLLLKEIIHEYTKNKNKAYVAFIDLSKAFDKVNHFILAHKLLEASIPPDIVLILIHYLRNQKARVCWNEAKGHYIHINNGVRQGGILSPFLFKFYINCLLDDISDCNVGCKYGLLRMNVLAYADDIVLIADSKSSLEYIYHKLNDNINKLKLNMNKNKSKCMIFERANHKSCISEIKLGNDTLEVVQNYKYLGHIVNCHLLEDNDVELRCRDFNIRFNSIFRNFNNVSVNIFLFLFDAFCLPDYGICLWNILLSFLKQPFKIFNTCFSNALKRIIGVPVGSSSHITAELCSHLMLKHHVVFCQIRYLKRILTLKNGIMLLCKPYIKSGYIFTSLASYFEDFYNANVWENELEVIQARIVWVQRHEERRGVCQFYGR